MIGEKGCLSREGALISPVGREGKFSPFDLGSIPTYIHLSLQEKKILLTGEKIDTTFWKRTRCPQAQLEEKKDEQKYYSIPIMGRSDIETLCKGTFCMESKEKQEKTLCPPESD